MFFSYVVYDTIEVEPVYFAPIHTAAAAAAVAANEDDNTDNAAAVATTTPYVASYTEVLVHRLTERYVGRVVPQRGLCVAIGDILDYSHSTVKGLGASAWLAATFEVCVFAPAPGTRMRARIAAQSPHGIALSIDFFACPLHVPAACLVHGSRYDATTGSWYLPLCEDEQQQPQPRDEADDDDDDDEATRMQRNYYMKGEDVVVRIDACLVRSEDDVLCDEAVSPDGGGDVSGVTATTTPVPPMELRGSFVGDGLGPTVWFE